GYQLQVEYVPLLNSLLGTVTTLLSNTVSTATSILANNDLHTNDSPNAPLMVQQALATVPSPLDYAFKASISDSSDVDFYRVTAPAVAAGQTTALTAMVWGTGSVLSSGQVLIPTVRVYDARGNPVVAQVLVNDGYTFTV